MNVSLQKKLMNFYVLKDVISFNGTLKKAKKDPTAWIKKQNKNIRKFVDHLYTIPFYKKRFDEAGVKPSDIRVAEDFLKLPVLTKPEFREWILEETKDSEKYKGWMSRTTTGSSGTPLQIYSLPIERAAEIANLFRCAYIQDCGYKVLSGRIFSTMVPKPKPQKKMGFFYNKQMSSISTPEELVAGYNESKPDFYYGNKTAVQMIADYALVNNIKLHRPKCVGSISEALDDNARRAINKAFFDGEEKLFDIYGCAEVGNFAVEKAGDKGKHTIWNDTHVVNVLNKEMIDEEKNIYRGQIVITSLIHWGFPLVNYVIGDDVEIKEENGVKYITKILGRSNDVIKNEDGSSFKWFHISRIMYGNSDIKQFRVFQKAYDKLLFMLSLDNDNPERRAELEATIKARGEELFGTGATKKDISIEWVDRIPPDPTGKIRILICEI